MKNLLVLLLTLYTTFLWGQSLKGDWHGKILDVNGEALTYINISITNVNGKFEASLRKYDKTLNKWVDSKEGNLAFISDEKNAILSQIQEKNQIVESNVFMFSYISSKRIAIEWVNQINNINSQEIVLTKNGAGFLEPFLNGKIYENLSIGGTSTNRVSIDKVEIAKEQTVITFSYHNTSFEQVMMRLTKPGENGAYYITPLDRSKKYYIINKDNIAYEPDNTLVAPNSYHTFKIYFEPLPETLTSFSILEGDPEHQTGKEWNFYDIQLK